MHFSLAKKLSPCRRREMGRIYYQGAYKVKKLFNRRIQIFPSDIDVAYNLLNANFSPEEVRRFTHHTKPIQATYTGDVYYEYLDTKETTDHQGTINLIMKLHRRIDHVLVVLDRTVTGNAIREEFRKIEEVFKGTLNF